MGAVGLCRIPGVSEGAGGCWGLLVGAGGWWELVSGGSWWLVVAGSWWELGAGWLPGES